MFFIIGLMSGTSVDGVDASFIETNGDDYFKPIANLYLPYSQEFQIKLKKVMNDKRDWFDLEIELTKYHANCVNALLVQNKIDKTKVTAIGFSGQTIYHNPKQGVTWQIGNPHLLAKLTNIDVISDFRRRDVAFGGNGAPLIPVFHQCLMHTQQSPVAMLNIGGVANITYIHDNEIIAFDTGPGNSLINDAMIKHYNKLYDHEGLTAKLGKINRKIIQQILNHPFFNQLPPKSLDRNDFMHVAELVSNLTKEDSIATLTELTVSSITAGIALLPKVPLKVYLCGGGTHNKTILESLQNHLNIHNIDELGCNPDFIESQGFAYLAARFLRKLPSSFSSTTGVTKPTIAGVLYSY